MKKSRGHVWIVGAAAFLLALAGCDSITGGEDSASPLKLIGTSGEEVSMNGSWSRGCIASGGESADDTWKFDGAKVTITHLEFWNVTDCSGSNDLTLKIGIKVENPQPVTMTDWVNPSGSPSTPPTGLKATEEANGTTDTMTSASATPENDAAAAAMNGFGFCGLNDWAAGQTKSDLVDCMLEGADNPSQDSWVVDDTTSTAALSLYGSPDGAAVLDADGYPTEIENFDPLEK
jgi:hypothetical protein